jgi:hypothetical protein
MPLDERDDPYAPCDAEIGPLLKLIVNQRKNVAAISVYTDCPFN